MFSAWQCAERGGGGGREREGGRDIDKDRKLVSALVYLSFLPQTKFESACGFFSSNHKRPQKSTNWGYTSLRPHRHEQLH